VTSRAHASFSTPTPTPHGSGRIEAIRYHEQIREFCQFLAQEGEGTVIILMPFLLEKNRRHGPERLMVNGQQLVWRMRYRNMLGAEKAFLRIKQS